MNETKIICPCCGAEFAIPEHQYVSTGTVVGKDSNLGIIHPTVVKPGNKSAKALQRIEALKKAGIEGDFFATTDGHVARLDKSAGIIEPISDDDPLFNGILDGGTIPNRNLFRRWVMAQVFRGLDYKGGFVAYTHRLGYRYMWKMLIEEIRVQARMERDGAEEFLTRRMFFGKDVCASVAGHFIKNVNKAIDEADIRSCKGRPYKRILGRNVFIDDISTNILSPLHVAAGKISGSSTTGELYGALKGFRRLLFGFRFVPQCPEWMDAYKGAGAYYTLKNMLLFHGCHIIDENGVVLERESAVDYLNHKAHEYEGQGWRLFGMLRKCISDNSIDVHKMRSTWRK